MGTDTPETTKLHESLYARSPLDRYWAAIAKAKKLERERDEAMDLAHDLAVELYSSQHITKDSNADRLIKMAMNTIKPPTE